MKITIIGGGIMGTAIAGALIKQKVLIPTELIITDTEITKLEKLASQGVKITTDNLMAIQTADVLILAVKPQIMSEVLLPLQSRLLSQTLVLSIAAGVTLSKIQKDLAHQAVVRVMPNTPLTIGMGVSGWFASAEVTDLQKQQVKQILNACGIETELENEDQIDAITALSGSGPAYVFLFLQGLVEGAVKLGLSENTAKQIAIQTVLGSAFLAQSSEQDLQTLIENVTSKGGTTEKAREKFTEHNFQNIIMEAMQAAYQQAKKLSKK